MQRLDVGLQRQGHGVEALLDPGAVVDHDRIGGGAEELVGGVVAATLRAGLLDELLAARGYNPQAGAIGQIRRA